MGVKKNFTYGEIWADPTLNKMPSKGTGREQVNPYDWVNNDAFVRFMRDNGYKLFIDYEMDGYAHTNVTGKVINVNGNYPVEVIESFIQHELGHLMLFDVNQFVTVGKSTMRSVIAEVIYTPKHLTKYGMKNLLLLENIIQDIIIETVSGSKCVCTMSFAFSRQNIGVKHLRDLENIKDIARETTKEFFKKWEEPEEFTPEELEALKALFDSMLRDLDSDIQEIEDKLAKTRSSREFENARAVKRRQEFDKLQKQLRSLENKLSKKDNSKLRELAEKVLSALEKNTSVDRLKDDAKAAQEDRERAVRGLEKKLETAETLREAIEESVSGASSGDESGEAGGDASGGSSETTLKANYTDRNSPDTECKRDENDNSHSFDCGFPYPVKLTRDEGHDRDYLKTINSTVKGRLVTINEDDASNVVGGNRKAMTSEFTYFKSNKKEFDATDMLRGKRRERITGINVLVGLDVSGSMTREWTTMFTEISGLVEELQEKLEIENIVYFTYNQKLQEWNHDFTKLDLRARGGNAFGYVYQDIMQELPMLQRNEIILVTDCGDNLGFKLDTVCRAERKGIEVENHVSIIDTEGAGFYAKKDFFEDDWDIYSSKDKGLFKALEDNINDLIER